MGTAVKLPQVANALSKEELDKIFLKIFEDLGRTALNGASSCTSAIFQLSANYMEKRAFDTLRKFYELYFSRGDIEQKKDEVNAEVDDLVAQLQEKMAAGEELTTETDINEDQELKQQRLSLAAVQKQLEGLIVLDNGIKEQILPALSSMQFEDAVSQRLQHVIFAWWKVGDVLHKELTPKEVEEVAKEIAAKLTSVEETKSFYEIVLKEKPPEGSNMRSVFIEF